MVPTEYNIIYFIAIKVHKYVRSSVNRWVVVGEDGGDE